MTWVPELRTKAGDPWAHRKGEPRPLALLWSLYLMASALVTLLRVRSLTMPTTEQFAFGCRSMVLMVMIGVAVLWPMVRLSQQFPKRRHLSLLADLVVLLIPVQAVVWPMPLLTHWPLDVTAAVVVSIASWALLSAGVLAFAYGAGSAVPRWCLMIGCVAVAIAAPAADLWIRGLGGGPTASIVALWSPLTAVWGVTSAPSGLMPVMQRWEWAVSLMPGVVGGLMWAAAARFARMGEAGYSVAGPGEKD
jgi:hypothetical protein